MWKTASVAIVLALSACADPHRLAMKQCQELGYDIGTPGFQRCYNDNRALIGYEQSERAEAISRGLGTAAAIYGAEQERRQENRTVILQPPAIVQPAPTVNVTVQTAPPGETVLPSGNGPP